MKNIDFSKLSKEDRDNIIKEFSPKILKDARNEVMIDFARQLQSSIANNEIIAQKKNMFSEKFDKVTVSKYLDNPQKYENKLRELSVILYTMSPQYQGICNYLSAIAKFIPIASPNMNKYSSSKGEIDGEKLLKDYNKIINNIDNMNIQHEFQKILSVCTREDIFYGYEYETNDSYYIQQLDSEYCKISSIEDGCFNFAFDFGYFDKYKKIKGLNEDLILNYPSEFQTKYNIYLSDKTNFKWQELDSAKTICIKFLEDLPFIFPPFASLFSDVVDLSDYKALSKTKTEVDNYKFIGLKLPLLSKGTSADDFAVDPETALSFYNMILSSLPSGIGAFISATDFEPINFSTNTSNDKNEVNNAENNLFSASGITPINFGKGATNAGTVKLSNFVDQSKLFKVYAQFERWLNRKYKKMYNNKFTIKLLRVSEWNLQDERDNALKQAQYGVPNKLILSALNGISQQQEQGLSYLETNILKIHDKWIPLQSSHTQSGDGKGNSGDNEIGRPLSDDTDLNETGEQTRSDDSNSNK
ncbi:MULTISPECIES: hypothetical protein [unclassified Clostridium]|uniref:hypothetical protein n=1 Tax=unclassified Clostridium TaxID=2614128 RepID=UPI00207ACC08|nr:MULTISPECIES: hypothetical protein [unclassified Clostridium]